MARRQRRIVSVVSVISCAIVVFSVLLFICPSKNAPKSVGAVIVLGGSGPRLTQGEKLVEEGFAHVLVVSTSPTGWYCPLHLHNVQVICFEPHPSSTRGEARFIGHLQGKYHWNSIIVVTATPQTTRARVRIERCFSGDVLFDPVDPGGLWSWIYNTFYEWGALFKALVLQRSC